MSSWSDRPFVLTVGLQNLRRPALAQCRILKMKMTMDPTKKAKMDWCRFQSQYRCGISSTVILAGVLDENSNDTD